MDTLSPALVGKYELNGTAAGEIETVRFGRIDLRTLSLERAAALVATGRFSYLVAVREPEPPSGTTAAEKAAVVPTPPRRRRKPQA
jgi:hypothetical protein